MPMRTDRLQNQWGTLCPPS